jgi:hypothetical protein
MNNQNTDVSPEEFKDYLQLLLQFLKSPDININYSVLKTENQKLNKYEVLSIPLPK